MIDGRVPRWTALLREALAVLAAILVAFALDAWWDARVERNLMLEALDAVATELERNRALVDSTLAFNEERAGLVQRAATLTLAEIEAFGEAELLAYADLPNYQLATLELGAATAFIEGGFLAVVEDREARADVAGLPRLQLELDEEATVVLQQSDRLNRTVFDVVPARTLLGPRGANSPEATRAFLRAIVQDEDVLRTLLGRTFFLNYLYAGELQATRDRLVSVSARVEEYRAR